MKRGAQEYARKCEQRQRHASSPRLPSDLLHSITSPWPFAQWGIDLVGPFPTVAQKKLLLVATDYFTKWVKAEAYATIKDKDVTKFVWKNIVCRFGILQAIVSDNGPQFASTTFKNFCSELKIKNLFSTPSYPQGNGQAETANKAIVGALKKRLHGAKGGWVDELPGVLWAHRTTPRRPINATPFALAFGMEAVIPTEIGMPTARTSLPGDDGCALIMRNLDWANEEREAASVRLADYQ